MVTAPFYILYSGPVSLLLPQNLSGIATHQAVALAVATCQEPCQGGHHPGLLCPPCHHACHPRGPWWAHHSLHAPAARLASLDRGEAVEVLMW